MSVAMSDQTSSNNVAEFFSPGPGERLRAARLSMGYDLAKIASELHLTTPVVEALEADDFGDIGARVFVRGYLRNYARIVGMPVESILRQFDEKWPDEAVKSSMLRQSPRLPADGGPSRGWAGAMTWLLLIGAVALFLMWWRGYLDEIVPPQIRSTGTSDSVAELGDPINPERGPSLFTQQDSALADGSLRLPAPPSDLPLESSELATSPETAGQAPATPNETSVDAMLPGALALPTVGSGSTAASLDGAAAPSPAVAASVPPVVAPATPSGLQGAPVVDGTQQIVMTFTGACWVDVRDSERKFKLFGEMPKGTRKVLGGKPPYKLVIGNAKAVSITVNGKPFDLAPYAKGNVARFTLDP